ncbi:MAG: TonB-dependent receptor plug domain-containing protein, partial [Pseudomonadota bacterium]
MRLGPILLIALCVSGHAFADDGGGAQDSDRVAPEQNTILADNTGLPAIPVELSDYLDKASNAVGLSFIFNTRIVEGKTVDPTQAQLSKADVERNLQKVGLALHRIDSATYVVKSGSSGVSAAVTATTQKAGLALPDVVLVSGTRLASNTTSAFGQSVTLDRTTLDQFNDTTTEQVIFSLPQNISVITSNNTALFGSIAGLNLADLRGLGSQRTSVFVDGYQQTLTVSGNGSIAGFDLNAIPQQFLERIELETGPSAARRNARALAGSINFTLRKSIDELEAGGRIGTSERGDAEEISVYALTGRSFAEGAGSVTFGAAANILQGLIGEDRPETAIPFGFSPDGEFLPGFGRSPIGPNAAVGGVVLDDGEIIGFSAERSIFRRSDGTYGVGITEDSQRFNWSGALNTVLPQERGYLYAAGDYEVTPDLTLSTRTTASKVRTEVSIEALPTTFGRGANSDFGDATAVNFSSPIVPSQLRSEVNDIFGPTVETLLLTRRFTEVGLRRDQLDRLYLDTVVDLEYNSRRIGQFNAFYRYGRNSTKQTLTNRVDLERLNLSLQPDQCLLTPGCVSINLLDGSRLSEGAADFIRSTPVTRRLVSSDQQLGVHWLSGGSQSKDSRLNLNAGVEYTRTRLDERTDEDQNSILGSFRYTDFTADLESVDLVGGLSWQPQPPSFIPGEVGFSINARGTFSPDHETAHNLEFAASWRPIKTIELFSNVHLGERPPTIAELFVIGGTDNFFTLDPCSSSQASQNNVIETNCQSSSPLGVGDVDVTAGLATRGLFGNPNLENENFRSFIYGVRYTDKINTSWASINLNLSFAWLEYELENEIAVGIDPLSSCLSSLDLSDENCGENALTGNPIIERDPVSRRLVRYDEVL